MFAHALRFGIALSATLLGPVCGAGDWVEFELVTPTRLVAPPELGTADFEEKDFAVGDVDNDGDLDLVIVRKEPFSTPGRRVNVFFRNDDGVLVDRTADYAADSDVPGDQGFLTPTNDRDVALADVDGDGWLDIITAPALSEGTAKAISHPRIYHNRGESGGVWQGWRYEDARIPQLAGTDPVLGTPHAPRFTGVAAGDLDDDGDVDLYFVDHDDRGPMAFDFNDRLLINDGNGYFADETSTRFAGSIILGGGLYPFPRSKFATACAIGDMNGDGALDILKDTANGNPLYAGISYNDPDDPGTFENHDAVYTIEPYFINIGDLNDDGRLDLIISDDIDDRYLLNEGNDAQGRAIFSAHTYEFAIGGDDGFGGNNYVVDLNNDGFADVINCDVDTNLGGCTRRLHLYHNLGDSPDVTLREPAGAAPWTPDGVHDIATIDLDEDGWLDLVIGTCTGMQVWRQVAPIGLLFTFPDGRPDLVPCDEGIGFPVEVVGVGGGVLDPGSLSLELSLDGGPFVSQPVVSLGAGLFELSLPAATLATRYAFYLSAGLETGESISDPPGGALDPWIAHAADEVTVIRDDLEMDTGWTVVSDPALTAGAWERADPTPTFASGDPVAPGIDASPEEEARFAFVTEDGEPGDTAASSDVDGGPTHLISPAIDLEGIDATITWQQWFVCIESQPAEEDQLAVAVSNDDGASWIPVLEVATTGATWETGSFQVGDFVVPTAVVRVRFTTDDSPNNSVTEAAVDELRVIQYRCRSGGEFVRGDVNGDASADVGDAVSLLSALFTGGALPACEDAADVNDDGQLNVADAIALLAALFTGGPPPPVPGPDCGVDETDDTLGCESFAPCE